MRKKLSVSELSELLGIEKEDVKKKLGNTLPNTDKTHPINTLATILYYETKDDKAQPRTQEQKKYNKIPDLISGNNIIYQVTKTSIDDLMKVKQILDEPIQVEIKKPYYDGNRYEGDLVYYLNLDIPKRESARKPHPLEPQVQVIFQYADTYQSDSARKEEIAKISEEIKEKVNFLNKQK